MSVLSLSKSNSHLRPRNSGVIAVFLLFLSAVGTAILAQEDGVQILLAKEAVSIGSTVLCSEEELEAALSEYTKEERIHIENDPGIDTTRVLKLLKTIREFGFENVTSTSPGEPGWTLYPYPDDLDVFGCETSLK